MNSANTPTFLGLTDGSGEATATTTLPNDPSLQDCIFSMQAVAGSGTYRVSNLIRVTPQESGTFRPSLTSPALPIAGGMIRELDELWEAELVPMLNSYLGLVALPQLPAAAHHRPQRRPDLAHNEEPPLSRRTMTTSRRPAARLH